MELASVSTYMAIHTELFLLIDIFKHKSITEGVVYNCNDDNSNIILNKILFHNNLKMSVKKIKHLKNNPVAVPHSFKRIGLIVNTTCEGWHRSVLDGLDALTYFKSPFVWIMLSNNISDTTNAMKKTNIEADSDITITFRNANGFDLFEIYYTGHGRNGKFILRKAGHWHGSLFMDNQSRSNLQGVVLRAVVVINHNQKVVNQTFVHYLMTERPGLDTVDPMHKFKYFEMLQYYRDLFNISYEYQRTNSWGYPGNGSFDGMVGALQRGEADIGGSPIFVRTDRAAVIEYAAETWRTRPCFIFLSPPHPGGAFAIYWRPLSARVWWCAAALLALAGAALAAMLRLRALRDRRDAGDSSPGLALLFVWSAICQQGMAIDRRSTSIKLASLSVLVFALTLYQYYNATVVSTLLHEAPGDVRSVRDLLRTDMRAGIEDVLYIKDFFKRTTDPVALELYRTKIVKHGEYNFYSAERGLALVRRGGFAFHVDSALAYRVMRRSFTERQLCAAAEVSLVVPQYLGAAVPRRSPYREHVARAVRLCLERGLMHRLRDAWDAARPACARRGAGARGGVSARECAAPLCALGAGLLVAALLLAIERRMPPN